MIESIYFEREYAVAQVISLYELNETFLRFHTKLDWRVISAYNKIKALLADFLPNCDTSQFSALSLMEFRLYLIGKGYERKYINKLVGMIRRMFKWAVPLDLVSPILAFKLSQVKDLEPGETDARENPEREAAAIETIIAVLSHLPEQIRDMILLQALTGMRPSEICGLIVSEIIKDSEAIRKYNLFGNWLYLPKEHKTSGKDKQRPVVFDETAQIILKKYMDGKEGDAPLFCNLQKRRGRAISVERYGRILAETIETHGLPKFTPYQIRHTNGTWISDVLDRDHARAQLGHSSVKTTGIYDHSDSVVKADIELQKAILLKRKEVGCAFSRYVIDNFSPAMSHKPIFTGGDV
jgi:integrase